MKPTLVRIALPTPIALINRVPVPIAAMLKVAVVGIWGEWF